ncbi:flavin-containing superfamily Amine oxidase [Colletotrichum graminicola]|uniref:Flavin-containing superfamily Amine oxidase n=1 Tax=Colletotrichum graminicola (strain M1.001 / M2 / FGSC 10212) TaxID=645133 RepID=E3QVN4_COLGM|nr:flavin-containing superfamily Amine oxidase [Colletotrichum graminicola M1.001]EFQ34922.1 flavin-containing superfamily Amine oxidase [Colletotrichum graminicola M1.001]WDK12871.1 flavin-containing superfamily Amine oxidase [Colletotrichum graminicola]
MTRLGKLVMGFFLLQAASGNDEAAPEILKRDVAVIGGGSSGTYAAVRLQQLGKSVALIEKAGRLGGHTNTYVDAKTGMTFDYGTQNFVNTTEVYNYFRRLGVPLAPFAPKRQSVAVDMARERPGPSWPIVNANDTAAALERYKVQLAKYPDDFFRGYHLPDPVPEDLLLPWGDFVQKYDLGALAYDGWLRFQGMGNVLAQPTLYVMKLFNPMQVRAREENSKVYEANDDLQSLWNAAQAFLGDSAVTWAEISRIDRQDDCVTVSITTPSGPKTVHASKLLITIPPTLDNLKPFLDLSDEESQVFGQLNNSYYYNAVISRSGFPAGTSVYSYDLESQYGIPAMPGVYYFTAETVSDLWSTQYTSPDYQSEETVKATILAQVHEARRALGRPDDIMPEIMAFNNHSPFGLTVSTDAIRSGFYKRYTALQSQRNTFWTGHSWSSGSSSTIWDFTEYEVLPAIMASLEK